MKKLLLFTLALSFTALTHAQDDESATNKAPGDFLDVFNSSRKTQESVRTTTNGVFALGWNQALGNGNGIGDDYRFWGSGSWELGLEFSTRLSASNDNVRINYGLAARWQTLRIRGDRAFSTSNNITDLTSVPLDLDKSRFTQGTLIAPLHIEIGAGTLKEYDNGMKRYDRESSWRVGLGGYVGINAGTTQSIKYEREGRNVTQSLNNDFEMEPLVYGLSGYVGKGDVQIFAIYGLNEIFKDSPVQQNMVSIGFRFQ